MDREFLLLKHISEGGTVSQRSLAKDLDVSLGTVNGLMQHLLQDGLLTVDTTSQRQIIYTLTELGIKRKAHLYHDWIVQSYHTISKTKCHIKGIIEKQISNGIEAFFLYGFEDEMFKLVKMCLMELKREHPLHYHHLTDLGALDGVEAFCLLHWDIQALFEERLNAVNVLFESI